METKIVTPKYIIERIRTQKHPVKFLLSRILWPLKICRLFTVNLSYGVKIKFFPTSTSAALWVDPQNFDLDGVDLVWNYLSKGDFFVDVGANIGQLTLIGAKKVSDGQIVSIEPHPQIFKFLNKNIKLNRFKNVKTHNFAIGDKDGAMRFSDIRSDDQNFITNEGPVSVKVRRLDTLLPGAKIDLLKIDTEGYELFVLRGAEEILSETKVIFFESYETNFARYGYSTKDITKFLTSHGFKVVKFLTGGEIEEVLPGHISQNCENLLAVKDINFFMKRLKHV